MTSSLRSYERKLSVTAIQRLMDTNDDNIIKNDNAITVRY